MTDLYLLSSIKPLHSMQAERAKIVTIVNTIPKIRILTLYCQNQKIQMSLVQAKLQKKGLFIKHKVTVISHSIQMLRKLQQSLASLQINLK